MAAPSGGYELVVLEVLDEFLLVVCGVEPEDLGEELYGVLAEFLCLSHYNLVCEAFNLCEAEHFGRYLVEMHCSGFFVRVDHIYDPAL